MMFCCRLAGWAGWRIGGEPCAGSGMQPRQGSCGRNPTRARASLPRPLFSARAVKESAFACTAGNEARDSAHRSRGAKKGATALEVAPPRPRDTAISMDGPSYLPAPRPAATCRERASEADTWVLVYQALSTVVDSQPPTNTCEGGCPGAAMPLWAH